LIRVPSGKSPAATFGSAVHDALKRAFRKVKEGEDEFPPTEEFMQDFKAYIYRNRDAFTKEEFKLRWITAKRYYPAYYNLNTPNWNKVTWWSLPIKNLEIAGVPVKGNLDKVEFHGKDVTIVDYKTGKLKNAKDKFPAARWMTPNGGDYWRQACFINY
jgi:DNA helicase-2/ATP-dependent DNA helicase PcrA